MNDPAVKEEAQTQLSKLVFLIALAALIPPLGIVAALRLDGHSPGPLSDLGFFILPLPGLSLVLPQLKGWLARLAFAIVYLGVALVTMFVVGASFACAWYRACL